MREELIPEGGWADAPVARMVPTPSGGARLLSALAKRFGRKEVPQVFTALAQDPSLFWPWLIFASRLLPYGKLPADEREILILRTAWNCRSRYEWVQHIAVGLAVGLSDEAILRIARGPSACEDPHERALLSACDELATERRVSDATWAHLAACYDPARLVELLVLVGHYQLLAGFLNTLGLTLEPQVLSVLDGFQQRTGLRV